MRERRWISCVLLLCVLAAPTSAAAQDLPRLQGTEGFLSVPSELVMDPGDAALWWGLQFGLGPEKPRLDPVPVGVAAGVLKGLEIAGALRLPVRIAELRAERYPDPLVGIRYRLLAQQRRRPGITVGLRARISGDPEVLGTVVMGVRRRAVHVAGSISGGVARDAERPVPMGVLTLGVELRPDRRVFPTFETRLSLTGSGSSSRPSPDLVFRTGVRFVPSGWVSITPWAAIDMRLTGGFVSAGFVTTLTSLSMAPSDHDHDEVGDWHDRCPELAEDEDGFQDLDGCPDLDNDGDGIPDSEDATPDGEAEVVFAFPPTYRVPRELLTRPRSAYAEGLWKPGRPLDYEPEGIPLPPRQRQNTARAGDLLITEVMIDPQGVADRLGEWFELLNISQTSLVLEGIEIRDDSGGSHQVESDLLVEPGQFVVLASSIDPRRNGGVDAIYQYSDITLGNTRGSLSLYRGEDLIDQVRWIRGRVPGLHPGRSLTLDSRLEDLTTESNDDDGALCGGSTPLANGVDFGTPGQPNDDCACFNSDTDRDGYGVDASCAIVDCDDSDPQISPAGLESCDGVDNDCDGRLDNGYWMADDDGDGWATCRPLESGEPERSARWWTEMWSDGKVLGLGDCDDINGTIFPGAAELCDALDNDCDGKRDEDFDRDGDGWTTCLGDCEDGDDQIHPEAKDECDGVDTNCDGRIDDDAAGDPFEPNDDAASAFHLLGDDARRSVSPTMHSPADDEDWFEVSAIDGFEFGCDGFVIEAWLRSIPPGADYDLELLDADLQVIDRSTSAGSANEHVRWSAACVNLESSSGVYYVVVKRKSGWSCSDSYTLTVSNAG